MGFVDLWHDLLLCDVLHDEPKLRGVPMPLPYGLVSCNRGRGTKLGCPVPFRGIAFVNGSGLRLVHLEPKTSLVPGTVEAESINFQMHEWTIVTYTNSAMTSSWKDWRTESRIKAKDITMDPHVKSQLLQSGLLDTTSGQAFHNLLVSHPTPDISHEGVVYLTARKKYGHPEVWVIAVDTRKKALLGVVQFATENEHTESPMYCPGCIAKYTTHPTTESPMYLSKYIFIENAGELRFIILRRLKPGYKAPIQHTPQLGY
jgi:hypothetical protein